MTKYHTPASYHSDALNAVGAAFLAMACAFVLLRFFVRGIMIRGVGWDDWLILLAMAGFACQCAFLIHLTWLEKNVNMNLLQTFSNALEYVILEFAFYLMTTAFLKMSLAIFFLRIIIEKWQRRVIIAFTTIFSVYTFVFFFIAIFQCGAPKLYLLHKIEHKCIPWEVLGPLNYTHGILNALTDWIFASLPILVVRKANMRGRDKSSVMLVLAIGVLGSVASVVRLFYIQDLHTKTSTTAAGFFSSASTIAIASIIEPGLGITAACMATLRPLFKRVFDHTRTHITSTAEKNKTTSGELGLGLPPQSPHRSEFAQYGFAGEGRSTRAKSEPHVELVELPSGKVSNAGSDESDRPIIKRESQEGLVAELSAARAQYEARIWGAGGEQRTQPNLLLPDV